ncbi:MAG: hypothetical protein L6Q92_12675 [Phycisphaerae bacterium]|nr:hypothetical protein [Phycisphaerae bacterium]
MATEIRTPAVLSMIVCDGVHRDPSTGKFTILGTFNIIGCRQTPVTHEVMFVYLALTDALGTTPLTLDLVSADETTTIFKSEVSIDVPDPLVVVELPLQARNVTFENPGEYRLRLFCADEPLMERRIVVAKLPEPGEARDASDESND